MKGRIIDVHSGAVSIRQGNAYPRKNGVLVGTTIDVFVGKDIDHIGEFRYDPIGLDHGIGHLASMSPQKNERLTPNKG